MNIQTQILLSQMDTLSQKIIDLKTVAQEANECASSVKSYVDAHITQLPDIQQVVEGIAYQTQRVHRRLNDAT